MLEEYRNQIDDIDMVLVEYLENRLRIVEKIAEYKKDADIPIENQQREEEVRERILANASPDLSDFILSIYDTIISECRNLQYVIIE